MPELMALALFERRGRTLVARRKAEQPSFAGGWLLPGAVAAEHESVEEALERHLHHELGIESEGLDFAETIYIEDAATAKRYVANVFRVLSYEGQLRIRAAGEYEDARWLSNEELGQIALPAALLTWLAGDRRPAPTGPVPVAAAGPAPDNRAAWNTISRAYQERYRIPTDDLTYGPRCPGEGDLRLLGDLDGRKAVVLGCGGGQDCIVLAKRGAQVIGIDLSDKQIEYGRRLADREGVFVTLLQGNVEDLGKLEDESQDLALSIHALNYVERIDRAFAEAYRVLRQGGAFVFSVHHPFDACLEGSPPYGVQRPYWQREIDWEWDFPEAGASARMRSWYRTIEEWVTLLSDAGFRVERLLEPQPTEEAENTWDSSYDIEKMRLVPAELIAKAVKP